MKKSFLSQFLSKISEFPQWVKEIIYAKLSEEIDEKDDVTYVFATYRPVLTYKGSEIILNTYMSMEEIANYFIFCVDEGYIEIPDNSQILNIAGFIVGKYRTGEYFVQNGIISEEQLNGAIDNIDKEKNNKKFGQILIDSGLITKNQLDKILALKEEAKKRFVLDHNEIPVIKQVYTQLSDDYKQKIDILEQENKQLKMKLNQLLTMVRNNDNE